MISAIDGDTVIDVNNPASGEPMYKTGRDISKFKNNYLPYYLWRYDQPTVYMTKYESGTSGGLEVLSPQILTNRFSWEEVCLVAPGRP